jgi:hypothetical protein
MRGVLAGLAVLAAVAAPAAARAAEKLDAQMLLDLDLLREDPARYRERGAAERAQMLELLRLLETPSAATPAGEAPGAPRPTPPPAQGGVK